MTWLAELVERIRRWWLGPMPEVVIDPGLITALSKLLDERDWFLWECEQIRLLGYAPWLDPYRYEGTPFAYPLPTKDQLWNNFEASRTLVIERYGEERVNKMIMWADKNYDGKYDPESTYARSADPFDLAMKEYLAASRRLN